ncbi:NLP6-like protein [Drosera capensis]
MMSATSLATRRLESGNCEAENLNTKDADADTIGFPASVTGAPLLVISDMSFVVRERMTQALRYFRDLSAQNQILAQVWVPVKKGNQYLPTTSGQPFVLGPLSNGLHRYRAVSLMYTFNTEAEADGTLGLPACVFRQRLSEWTPNVQYYSRKEYKRIHHAKQHNVRDTLALPVFEPAAQSCVGVLELIMTSEVINYAPHVDKVCKALELFCWLIFNEGCQNAFTDILQVLRAVCEANQLPIAQTWVPCRHGSGLAYGSCEEQMSHFMSLMLICGVSVRLVPSIMCGKDKVLQEGLFHPVACVSEALSGKFWVAMFIVLCKVLRS